MRRRRIVVRLEAELLDALEDVRGIAVAAGVRCSRAALLRVLSAGFIAELRKPDAVAAPAVIRRLFRDYTYEPKPRPAKRERRGLRAAILAVMAAEPDEVFTPARLAPLVPNPDRDVLRNTLLSLHRLGKVRKVGEGQYAALPVCAVAEVAAKRPQDGALGAVA